MNITKTGILNSQMFNEYIIEPDGSIWEHVFHHNNPSINLFSSTDDFANGVYLNSNLWFNFNVCNELTSWEFIFKQKLTENGVTTKYRWIQNKNPFLAVYNDVKPVDVTRITTTGYTNGTFGGFFKNNSKTYFAIADTTSSNWFGATGSWTAFNNGTPGYPKTTITTGCMDAYVRIDSLIKAKIYKNDIIVSNNFYEY